MWASSAVWLILALSLLIGLPRLHMNRNVARLMTISIYAVADEIVVQRADLPPPANADAEVTSAVSASYISWYGIREGHLALYDPGTLGQPGVYPQRLRSPLIDRLRDHPIEFIRSLNFDRGPVPKQGIPIVARAFAQDSPARAISPLGLVTIPLMILGGAMIPFSIVVVILRIRERRRCQYAINRWLAGLCPVCKYPRDSDAICSECGRDMGEQAGLACDRMGTSLYDISPRSSAPALPPLDYTRD